MSEKDSKFKLPIPLLILDMIGVLLFAIGLSDWLGNSNFVPKNLQYQDYEKTMVVLGVLFMVPFILHMIKSVLNNSKSF